MNTILFFQLCGNASGPEKLAGALTIAEKENWHLRVIEGFPDSKSISQLLEFWHPAGCIICGGFKDDAIISSLGAIPTVFLDHDPAGLTDHALSVSLDSKTVGTMAAHELMLAGYNNFIFVSTPQGQSWSHERELAFVETLNLNGHVCNAFHPSGKICPQKNAHVQGRIHSYSEASLIVYQRQLRAFLKSKPRPFAIFAANDNTASEVIIALRALRIPDSDYSIIGVDNYSDICEYIHPLLTSIEPDFRGGGALAALMLSALLRNNESFIGERHRTYPPKRIVHRASTKRPPGFDNKMAEALELIEAESCMGLTAAKVASIFSCSRDMADLRFRKATGKTILTAIQERRLKQVKILLENPFLQLKSISDFCGYKSPNALKKFFRQMTGMSMTVWRKKMCVVK